MKKIIVIKKAVVNAKPTSYCEWAVDDYPMNKK
jgi:hypothetical protein